MTDILCGLFENKLSALPAPPNKLRNRQNRNEDYNPRNPFVVVLVLSASVSPIFNILEFRVKQAVVVSWDLGLFFSFFFPSISCPSIIPALVGFICRLSWRRLTWPALRQHTAIAQRHSLWGVTPNKGVAGTPSDALTLAPPSSPEETEEGSSSLHSSHAAI